MDEIEAASRAKAKIMHPDRGGSHEAISQPNEARAEVMKDRAG